MKKIIIAFAIVVVWFAVAAIFTLPKHRPQQETTAATETTYKTDTSGRKPSKYSASVSEPRSTEAHYDYDYVANKNTKKFHYPYCASVDDMAEKNKLYWIGDRQDLINMGYVPCQRCYP